MMKAIVFGGSGFLGSHVADALSNAGYSVTIFDLRPSAYLKKSQKMFVGSVLDEALVNKAIRNCQYVYNFAGISDIDAAREDPLRTVKYNILGNAIMLDASRKAKVRRFVFASSLYVYSKAGNFYRSTKQSCELLIQNYHEMFGLPYTILRYGSLYGPRSDERNFIFRIIRQALIEGRIVREGDGQEIREYIHAFDAAKGSVEILSNAFANKHVIISGNQQLKVRELILMIKEMLNNKIKMEFRKTSLPSHYEITPYSFVPTLAERIVHKTYVDLGQGILSCIQEMHHELSGFEHNDSPKRKKK